MNKIITAMAVGVAALTVTACASDYAYGPAAPRYGYVAPAPIAYDGYYDGAYGSFYDGYWDNDGAYYYTDAANHPFRKDEGNHFRHDMAQGFHGVNGVGPHHGGGVHTDGSHHPG